MSSDGAALFADCPLPLTQTEEILLGHGSGGKLTAQLIERLILPALPQSRCSTRSTTRRSSPVERLAARLHHRLLRRHADLLPRRRHRRARRQRHGERPRRRRRRRRSSCRSPSSSRRACRSPTCERVVDVGAPRGRARRRADRHRRHQGRRARQRRQDLHQHLRHRRRAAGHRPLLAPRPRRATRSSSRDRSATTASPSSSHARGPRVRRARSRATRRRCTSWWPRCSRACPRIHAMRDPTRGGVAATLVEIASRQRLGIEVDERAIPVRDAVRGACEILGLDPLLVANEGKLVAFVPEEDASACSRRMRAHPLGRDASRIGRVTAAHPGRRAAADADRRRPHPRPALRRSAAADLLTEGAGPCA